MDIDSAKAPRTHAAWKKAYDAQELAKLMVELSVQLEVELNVATANEAFAENKAYMLEKELKQAQDRIKERDEWNEKLDEIIDRLTEKIILLNEIRQEAGVQDANLREKLSAANERIKLLDEYIHNLQKLGDSMALGRNPFIQNAWDAAKEAKP
jgi:DNA repair exonuclease SbcCD ATPase subunit